jgi:ferredoxin-nitrite reductase
MMSRLRVPGGALTSAQALAIARAADDFGGGYVDLTTRANLQIREIPGRHMADLLTALHETGIVPRGSGADNIRNVTGNPTAGIDCHEFIDVLPLCRKLHHAILHDRTLYGLPRKFNVAFDGGNSISSLEDTNDIGLKAVMVDAAADGVEPGVYFRLALGGITGHLDLARDTGHLLKPEECLPVIKAILQVYIEHGDRGNRKKARLKYVLDAFGFARFMALVQEKIAFPLRSFPLEKCRQAPLVDKAAHLGVHAQRQDGLFYAGVDVPVGRLTSDQLAGLARLAARCGSGTLRLTVWQNLLLPDLAAEKLDEALEGIEALGLSHAPDPIAAGLVACTGAEGCQYGQAATKSTALAISAHLKGLKGSIALDAPVNIHLTGCPHSCAQHFIGDIGLIATKVEKDGYRGGGFHFLVGGGYGKEGRMAVAVTRSVPVPEVPGEIERLLRVYLGRRLPGESFTSFTARHADAELPLLFAADPAAVAADAPMADAAAGRAPV